MTVSWKDLLTVSLTVFVIGVILASYGVVVKSEGVIIASSILILFPIPFVMISYRGLKGEEKTPDFYGNAIIALITISIVSLLGYFLFATASGKAISLAIFVGTTLSLLVEYVNSVRRRRKRVEENEKSLIKEAEKPVDKDIGE